MKLKAYITALHAGLFAVLVLASPADSGSMMTMGAGKISATATGCTDTNVVAWEAAVVTAGGTVSTAQDTRVCTLVGSLRAHSLFTIQDRIWLHASENTQQATIDIVNFGVATNHGATFTTNRGYTGDGSSAYLDSGYAVMAGPNYTQNSASASTYVLTNTSTNFNNGCTVGMVDSTNTGNQATIFPFSNLNMVFDINNGGFSADVTNPLVNAQGFYTAVRTASAAQAVYQNSVATPAGSATSSSGAPLGGFHFFILARNNSNTPDSFSPLQVGITTMGAGMTGSQAAQFQTDLNAYMTSIGANVY